MKGLLLKDFYMTIKYCKPYFVILAVFAVFSFFRGGSLFWILYPCIFCGVIPIMLMGYDEKSRWNEYSGTLPYAKSQLVSSKYIFCVLLTGAYAVLFGLIHAVRLLTGGSFTFAEFGSIFGVLIASSLVMPSICLPFLFKFGVEKGRFVYIGVIMLIVIASSVLSDMITKNTLSSAANGTISLAFAAIIALFALSWFVSIKFFESRKL